MAAGIYQITCTSNGCRYIGSSKDTMARLGNHKFLLRSGTAHNKHMQHAWNKYGEESFTFETIEMVSDVGKLLEREQYWIDTLKPEFNKAKKADSGFLGQNHSEETRARLAEIQRDRMKSDELRERLRRAAIEQNRTKGNGTKGKPISEEKRAKLRQVAQKQFATQEAREQHSQRMKEAMASPETRQKISARKRGHKQTEETKKKRGKSLVNAWSNLSEEQRAARVSRASAAVIAAKAKYYDGFIAPDGTVYRNIYNLSAFCREHELSVSHMHLVEIGKRNHHKGWRKL